MSTVTCCESGMTFFCQSEKTFFVEDYIKGEDSLQAVKSVEFIALRKGSLVLLVEAKTSAPHPGSGEKSAAFTAFIQEIYTKAVDAFSVFMALHCARHPDPAGFLPEAFKSVDYAQAKFTLILVIKEHEQEWLPAVKDALHSRLRHFANAWKWGSAPVLVLNEAMAKQQLLLCSHPHAQT